MGTAEDLVVAGVNSQLGQQVLSMYREDLQLAQSMFSRIKKSVRPKPKLQGGQIAQSGFNQLQSNPNQFVQVVKT